MSQQKIVFLGLVIACAVYTPISMYLFDSSLGTMLERAYFTLSGAGVALYASS